MGNIIVKVHKGPDGSKVIAICDKEILGKKFEENNLQLDLSSDFYKGEEKEEKEVIDEIKKCSCSLNIVGKDSIEFSIKNNLVDKENIIKIKDIPHAQTIVSLD